MDMQLKVRDMFRGECSTILAGDAIDDINTRYAVDYDMFFIKSLRGQEDQLYGAKGSSLSADVVHLGDWKPKEVATQRVPLDICDMLHALTSKQKEEFRIYLIQCMRTRGLYIHSDYTYEECRKIAGRCFPGGIKGFINHMVNQGIL